MLGCQVERIIRKFCNLLSWRNKIFFWVWSDLHFFKSWSIQTYGIYIFHMYHIFQFLSKYCHRCIALFEDSCLPGALNFQMYQVRVNKFFHYFLWFQSLHNHDLCLNLITKILVFNILWDEYYKWYERKRFESDMVFLQYIWKWQLILFCQFHEFILL